MARELVVPQRRPKNAVLMLVSMMHVEPLVRAMFIVLRACVAIRRSIPALLRSSMVRGCSGNSQCASGQCVDGVCCESGCGSTCEACVQSKTGASNGLCRAIRSGNDYDNECADRSCSGDLRVAYSASTCSNRSCSSQTATSCGVYKCNNSTKACRTSCSSDSHCQLEGANLRWRDMYF